MLIFPKTSPETAIALLSNLLPDADDLLRHIEKSGGWLGLPPIAVEIVELSGIPSHAELYESETRILSQLWSLMVRDLGIRPATTRTTAPLQPELDRVFEVFVKHLVELGVKWDLSFAEPTKAQKTKGVEGMSMPPNEMLSFVRKARDWAPLGIALFYSTLSLVIHGEKLTSLVEKALSGDDESLLLAVQVDRTTLTGIAYFRARIQRAQLLGDTVFLRNLGYRIGNPILRGKIKYKRLWLALGMLDLLGHLDGTTTAKELLDILDSAGIERVETRLDDEGYLRKQVRDYRKAQERRRMYRPPN